MLSTTSFRHFIVEDSARSSDIARVLKAIERKMPSMLNTKLYRYGGPDGVVQLKGQQTAYLYFFGANKAFQVRVEKHEIVSFDVWKEYHPNKGPVFSIQTNGLSPLQIASELKKIASVIKAPKVTEIEVAPIKENEISFETDEDLFEAKSVSAEKFLELALKDISDAEAQSVTFDQIVKIARDNNVAVPGKNWLAKQKVGRGKWSLIPGTGGASDDESEIKSVETKTAPAAAPPTKGADSILFIKVTAQDPTTKKFLPTADNKAAQALYKQIQKGLDGPPTKEEIKDPETLYGHLNQLVEFACKGTLRSLLIYGGPGTGKTHTIMQTIEKMGLRKGIDYAKLSGRATAQSLYETLYQFRDGGMVLFDDLDSMWKDKDATNYLKAALDTSKVREISSVSTRMMNVSKWNDARREEYNKMLDRALQNQGNPDVKKAAAAKAAAIEAEENGEEPEAEAKLDKIVYPSTFNFTGRVVFISNLKKEEFDAAILSRSAKIDMSMTSEQILMRMKAILPHLGGSDVAIEMKQELLDHLVHMHDNKEIDMLTMREFDKGLNIVRSGAPNWKSLIVYM